MRFCAGKSDEYLTKLAETMLRVASSWWSLMLELNLFLNGGKAIVYMRDVAAITESWSGLYPSGTS